MKTARTKRNEPSDDGKALLKLGKKWLDRIEAAGSAEKKWLDDAKKAVQAYTNEAGGEAYGSEVINPQGYDFNILFSNVETIVPAVINSAPVPDIRRRFQDEDPAARIVSDILERAIRVQIDDSRLQTELEAVAQDAFLAGRGPIRLRFYSDIVQTLPDAEELEDAAEDTGPGDGDDAGSRAYDAPRADVGWDARAADFENDPDAVGEGSDILAGRADAAGPGERLENERIRFEAVSWVDYRHGPAKRWDERPWEAFRFCVPREDEAKSFNASLIGEQFSDSDLKDRASDESELIGWEIWDKDTKSVIFIDDKGTVLKKLDDPLSLAGFFCSPAPIQPVSINGRLMPVNPFSIYRRLAEQLDDAVRRKNVLIRAMKVRGWYGMSQTDLQSVLDLGDNEFSPVADPELWARSGGIEKAIAFWPFEKFIAAIQQIDAAIETYKQWIYEITGISDIVRGASVASETATAQNIKSQWGSLRIQKMQRLMERCARDLFVMMAEIIPAKFSPQTLEKMTGIPILPTPEDTPEQVKLKSDVMALMKRPLASYYRIDVESDSTVRADLTRQKQEVAEFLQGASAYFSAVAPLVQQGALPADAAVEIFAATARMFNLGKSVEDTLEGMVTLAKQKAQQAKQAEGQPQPPNPEQEAAAAKAQADQQAAAAKQQETEANIQVKQQELEMKIEAFNAEMQKREHETTLKIAEMSKKALADEEKAVHEAAIAELSRSLKEVELDIKNVELDIKREDLKIKQTPAPQPANEVMTDA